MAGQISLLWFRRDLRLEDNRGLLNALHAGLPVLPVFIFDLNIIDELPDDDARITFIHGQLSGIHERLRKRGSSLRVDKGDPLAIWKQYLNEYNIGAVFISKDYGPYAIERDRKVKRLLREHGIPLHRVKDQVIFEEDEIVGSDRKPYTVYTPCKRRWLEEYRKQKPVHPDTDKLPGFLPASFRFPSLKDLGFKESPIPVKPYSLSRKSQYHLLRDFPAWDATTHLSPHLRFGTVSIRQVLARLEPSDQVLLEELIWREFFMQILFHFPYVADRNLILLAASREEPSARRSQSSIDSLFILCSLTPPQAAGNRACELSEF
jgi:deoxyribodipyrimidine photo-lyase